MVEAGRRGASMRAVARQRGVSLSTVQRWVQRAAGARLSRVPWADRLGGCRRAVNRVAVETEDVVLRLRRDLKETSDLGEYGAVAIHRELRQRGHLPGPSVRTIGRVLERRGALDARRRRRWPAPPPGWYLPAVVRRAVESTASTSWSGWSFAGARTSKSSTPSRSMGAWPPPGRAAISPRASRWSGSFEHWRSVGLPGYVQFDNDSRFQGTHKHPDSIGRVVRVCLSLGVTPVFAPPRETGFQAAIEHFNGRWQAKVWARFEHVSLAALQAQSARFIAAVRHRLADRLEAAPPRRPLPAEWTLDLQRPLQGTMIFLRRTNEHGEARVLGHTYPVAPTWVHRLVRADCHLTTGHIAFYALRRRDPGHQPLLQPVPYSVPRKPFVE